MRFLGVYFLLCLFFQPIMAMDRNAAARKKLKNKSAKKGSISLASAPMPPSLENLGCLQDYFRNYFDDGPRDESSLRIPSYFFRIISTGPSFERIKGLHRGNGSFPGFKAPASENMWLFPLLIIDHEGEGSAHKKYANFLLSKANSKELLEKSRVFYRIIKDIENRVIKENNSLEEMSLEEMIKHYGLKNSDIVEFNSIKKYFNYGLNDLRHLVNILEHVSTSSNAQELELYLLTEYSIDLLRQMESGLAKILNNTCSDALTRRAIYIPNIKFLFKHDKFLLRQIYFTINSIALYYLPYANEIRKKANLKLINALEIDNLHFNREFINEEVLTPKKSIQQSQPVPVNNNAKNVVEKLPATPAAADDLSITILDQVADVGTMTPIPNNTDLKIEFVEAEPAVIDESPLLLSSPDVVPSAERGRDLTEQEPCLGDKIYSSLNNKNKMVMDSLFCLSNNALNQAEGNRLIRKVVAVLITLGQTGKAIGFHNDANNPHFFHPNEGKGAGLPSLYLEYRLIPFLLHEIIPSQFNAVEIVAGSKILRSHDGLRKIYFPRGADSKNPERKFK